MGSPLGAAKYKSLLQGAASLDRLGTTVLNYVFINFIFTKLVLCVWDIWLCTRPVVPNLSRLAAPCRRELYFAAPSGEPIQFCFKV